MASSLVGTNINTRVVELCVGRYNSLSNTGSMYAAVLPDNNNTWTHNRNGLQASPVPVAALAQISLPSKATGIVLACIGVGLTNPSELTACDKQNIHN